MPLYPFELEVLETVEETLINLYVQLGWNRKDELDPKLYSLNPQQWKDICGTFNEMEGTAAGSLFVCYGPSADESVPYGKIKIVKRRR